MAYGPTVHPPNGSCTLCIRHYVAMPHMAYSHVHPRLYSLVAIPYGCVYTACITYTYGCLLTRPMALVRKPPSKNKGYIRYSQPVLAHDVTCVPQVAHY